VAIPDDLDARPSYVQGVPIPQLSVEHKSKEISMRRTTAAAVTFMTIALAMTPLAAQAGVDPIGPPQDPNARTPTLDLVREATAAYHSLPNALDAGFVPFAVDGSSTPTCFDSANGGMGVHYVRNVDDTIAATDPEALVYEIAENGELELVGVEYVVPQEFVEDESGAVVAQPSLHGRQFHKHASLPLYVLHAWIWEENPEGMFADFNSAVGPCPANLAMLTIR
jgi:hypothetical protein